MTTLRRKAGTAKRRLLNASRELRGIGTPPAPAEFSRSVLPLLLAVETDGATSRLHGRLNNDDLAEIADRARADVTMIDLPVPPGAPSRQIRMTQQWADATGIERKRLDLTLGVIYKIPAVLNKTGLAAVAPPGDVHAMTRSQLGAGGSYYHADLVADALASAGAQIGEGDRGLDFGCSSGRVVRVLSAAFPEAEWCGCDPNEPATRWAAENLDGIAFSTSPQRPPLDFPNGHFSFAFGISIWSHFNERVALDWYREMHRLIRPGGHLISTTHGWQSIDFCGSAGLRSAAQLSEIRDALYRDTYWYAAEFGDKGDWGVVDTEWGTSFHSAEWLLGKLSPQWQLVEFAAARNEDNQDVYVLRRI